MRIAIIGTPRCGKSTLASKLAKELDVDLFSTGKRALLATDNFKHVPWEDVPDVVISRLKEMDDWILEGCAAVRVLRRWYRDDPDSLELDKVYYLYKPWVRRTPKQEAFAKGIDTMWQDVRPALRQRNIPIEYGVAEDPELVQRVASEFKEERDE